MRKILLLYEIYVDLILMYIYAMDKSMFIKNSYHGVDVQIFIYQCFNARILSIKESNFQKGGRGISFYIVSI